MINMLKRFSAPTVLIAFALLFPTQISWAGDKDKDKEPGPDPYTKMKPAAMKAAGYEKFGPFEITNTHTTADVEDLIGAKWMLWVETRHFKIGSILGEAIAGLFRS